MESILSYVLKYKQAIRTRAVRAFTLIEMLVSLGIIVVIMSVILLGQSDFSRTLILTDTSYTVAVSIRQMESYGISSLQHTLNSNIFTNAGYGVHFDSSLSDTYYEFVDIKPTLLAQTQGWCPTGTANTPEAKPGDCLYNDVSEQLASIKLNAGYYISSMCGIAISDGRTYCSDSTTSGTIDMVFLRPNTQTILTAYSSGVYRSLSSACIFISSPDGAATRRIKVTNLGQVTVTTDTSCT